MAKASSPIRLQEDLMKAAKIDADRFHRSAAEQIEYWADLGRSVANILDPDTLLSLKSGFCKLQIKTTEPPVINPEDIFESIENKRKNQTLQDEIVKSPFYYQSSLTHPEYLERIDQNGKLCVGQFINGEFIPRDRL